MLAPRIAASVAVLVSTMMVPVLAQQRTEPIRGVVVSDKRNTFVGFNAGNKVMAWEAADNTAVGENSFALNQLGAENTAVGANALWSNSYGQRNTAVGYVALAGNVDGIDNVALGHSAMYSNETGESNVAIGLQALYMNRTGVNNVAVGRDANFSNTTGSWNTGVGVDAIPGVETGVGNTGVGGESGYTENLVNQNVTGSFNTWVGYQAGPSSPAQHSGVIGIGHRAKTSKDHQPFSAARRSSRRCCSATSGSTPSIPLQRSLSTGLTSI